MSQSQSLAVREQAELAALEDQRAWDQLMRRAKLLASSGMVQKALQNKPEDCAVVMLACQDMGLPVTVTNLNEYHVIEGKPEPSAQLTLSLAHGAGYETRWGRNDNEVAELDIRRPGSERWEHFIFTLDDAKRAHLLDEFVEKWYEPQGRKGYMLKRVTNCLAPTPCKAAQGPEPQWAAEEVAKGNVKHKDNWWGYPADMLRARVAKRAVKAAAPEVRFGIVSQLRLERQEPDGPGRVVVDAPEPDDDGIVDAELVETSAAAGEETQAPDVTAAEPASAAGEPEAPGSPPSSAATSAPPAAEETPILLSTEQTLGKEDVDRLVSVSAAQAKLELVRAAQDEGLDSLGARAVVEATWRAYHLGNEPVARKTLAVVEQEVRYSAKSAGTSDAGDGTLFGGEQ